MAATKSSRFQIEYWAVCGLLALLCGCGAGGGSGGSGSGTPSPGIVGFTLATADVVEDASSLTISVARSNGSAGAVTVDIATADGTAREATDYESASSTLSWAHGEDGPKNIVITIIDDSTAESSETFTVALSNVTGAVDLGTTEMAIRIAANDAAGTGPYSVVHSFIGGADGVNPYDALIGDAAGNLYGTTRRGGLAGGGTVFMLDAGGNFLTLHNFGSTPTDGAFPSGLMARDSAGNLYGTTQIGGVNGVGTVFKIDAAGNETVLHHFAGGAGGAVPKGVLRDSNGNLYGVTINGGFECGTVFRLEANGTFTTLHRFAADGTEGCGAQPLESAGTQSGLIQDAAGNLYGTRYSGGAGDGEHGTIFRINAAGVFTTLYDFASNPDDLADHLVPRHPGGPLLLDDAGNLYGVTLYGGHGVAEGIYDDSGGIIFRLDHEGELSFLHEFALEDRYDGWYYSREPGGTAPSAGLVGDPAGIVFGTTLTGGEDRSGIIYRFDMRSHALEVIHTFTVDQGGGVAAPVVRDSAGVIYGTTPRGGDLACNPSRGCGTVFKIEGQ